MHVTVVQPGSFRTEFLSGDSRRQPETSIADYTPTVGAFQKAVDDLAGHQPGDPGKAIAALLEVAATENPPLRLPL